MKPNGIWLRRAVGADSDEPDGFLGGEFVSGPLAEVGGEVEHDDPFYFKTSRVLETREVCCEEKFFMPKLKTHKATSKRFKKTGTGKLVRTHIGKSHLRRRTSKRVKRSLDKTEEVLNKGNLRRVHRLAPFLK